MLTGLCPRGPAASLSPGRSLSKHPSPREGDGGSTRTRQAWGIVWGVCGVRVGSVQGLWGVCEVCAGRVHAVCGVCAGRVWGPSGALRGLDHGARPCRPHSPFCGWRQVGQTRWRQGGWPVRVLAWTGARGSCCSRPRALQPGRARRASDVEVSTSTCAARKFHRANARMKRRHIVTEPVQGSRVPMGIGAVPALPLTLLPGDQARRVQ